MRRGSLAFTSATSCERVPGLSQPRERLQAELQVESVGENSRRTFDGAHTPSSIDDGNTVGEDGLKAFIPPLAWKFISQF